MQVTAATSRPSARDLAGQRALLAELEATVFRFPAVLSLQYRINGSSTATIQS